MKYLLFTYLIYITYSYGHSEQSYIKPSKLIQRFKNKYQKKKQTPRRTAQENPEYNNNPFLQSKNTINRQIQMNPIFQTSPQNQNPQPTPTNVLNPAIIAENEKLENQEQSELIDKINKIETGNPHLNSVIEETLSKPEKMERPIIIINHNPQIHYTPPNTQLYDQYGALTIDPHQGVDFNNVKYNHDVRVITVDDIDTLFDVVSDVNNIYSVFFNALPQDENQPGKGNLEKAVDILKFYAKMRRFVLFVLQNTEQLKNDVLFLDAKVSNLKTDENDMLEFFHLDHRYFKVQVEYQNMDQKKLGSLKNSFDENFETIRETSTQFEKDANKIISGIYSLKKFHDFFDKEIMELQENNFDSTILNALDKFDKIMMMTLRLLELKLDLEKSIKETQEGFQNIKLHEALLNETLTTLEKLDDIERLSEKKIAVTKSVEVLYVFLFSMLLFVFLS